MSLNVYYVSIGNRPFARHVSDSFKKYLNCRTIQFTDNETEAIPGIDEVIRRDYDGHMMRFLIESFATIEDPTFITTADDCIINAPFDDIIHGCYDVAICKRTNQKMDKNNVVNLAEQLPYTNGLVVVKHPQFYADCLDTLNAIGQEFEQVLDWWGDMLAIREVLNTGRYRVLELPEDKYCRIPTRKGQGDDSAVLWHYSGNKRKWWMDYHGQGVPA